MMTDGGVVFGNWDSVEGIGDATLRNVAAKFRGVGRIVRLLHGRKPLGEILDAHGDSIPPFVRRLESVAEMQPAVKDYMTMQNGAKGQPQASGSGESLRHTVDLLVDLVGMDDWDGARDLAERTIDVSEGASRIMVARILALCLARSTEQADKTRAIELYQEAVASTQAEAGDYGALATLMAELGRYEEAKVTVEDGMRRFPDQSQAFVESGMRIVQVTGDRSFRDRLIRQARGDESE